MQVERSRIKAAWNQRVIPVVLRRQGTGEKTRARLPGPLRYSMADQSWLKNGRPIYPVWDHSGRFWQFPKKWFNDVVERGILRFGSLYIIQPFREQEVCARACMEAAGHECNCSCMGQNHGSGIDHTWFEVSDAFAVKTSAPYLACRLLKLKRPISTFVRG